VLADADRTLKAFKPGKELAGAKSFLEKLPEDGLFPKELRAHLGVAIDAADIGLCQQILEEAPSMPARWIVRTYLGASSPDGADNPER